MKRAILISALIILCGGAFGNYLRYAEHQPDRPPDFTRIPFEKDGYSGEEYWFGDRSYDVLQADTTTLRLYHGNGAGRIWLFVSYFGSQKYGSQIHSPKHCLPGGGWRIEKQETFDLPLPTGEIKRINRLRIIEGDREELMFYWFQTRGGTITNEFEVKWDLVKTSLRMQPTDAAFIRLNLSVPDGDIDAASEQAVRFFNAFYEDISKALPFEN
ncbi:MAG TPA: EpsI family protein [candidate division Zixibacteria bacterium]|nr:EpsI family protein [candidate division Zixibacteria bacterium]